METYSSPFGLTLEKSLDYYACVRGAKVRYKKAEKPFYMTEAGSHTNVAHSRLLENLSDEDKRVLM